MMKQYLILLGVVVLLVIPVGCDRPNAEDDREFDSDIDGLGFRLGSDSPSVSLGADQAIVAENERNRIAAGMTPTVTPKASPLDNTGLKPTTRPVTGTDAAGTGAAETGTGTAKTGTGDAETATGTGDKTAAGTDTGTGTDKPATGTGSAIDDILGGDK